MVLGVPALFLGAPGEHRELHDPEDVMGAIRNQIKTPRELEP